MGCKTFNLSINHGCICISTDSGLKSNPTLILAFPGAKEAQSQASHRISSVFRPRFKSRLFCMPDGGKVYWNIMHKYLLLGHFPAAAWPSLTRTHVVLSTAQNVYFAKEVQTCKDAKKYRQLSFPFYSSSTLVNG